MGEAFRIAVDMLRVHKMRAFLTMLGVIIGVMSVSLIVLALSAFQGYIQGQFSRIGSDTIFVSYAPGRIQDGESVGEIDGLRLRDIGFIRSRVPEIEIASGYREAGAQDLKANGNTLKSVGVRAIDENFTLLNRIEILEGRGITAQDQLRNANVALISRDAADELFEGRQAIGQKVQLGGITVEIVGITKPFELFGQRDTKNMFLPLATANSKWLGGDNVDLILMRPAPGAKVSDVMEDIWRALMVKSENKRIFSVESSENVLAIFQGILSTVGVVLAGIAALSLLVGGIGVMNIMLVSVTERTREIGLRKAVGAKPAAIMSQFLIESATLTLIGGLIGMLLAWMMGMVMTLVTVQLQWPREGGLVAPFPLGPAVGAIIFSAVIGVVFGFYPAARASKLHPIEALRSE